MPNIVRGELQSKRSSIDPNEYSYEYPRGLNLRPRSRLHDKLRDMILEKAQESWRVMQDKHEVWKKLDNTLTMFIDQDEEEQQLKAKDPRKPTSIVVPSSFAILDSLMTYSVAVFLQEPYFKYEGVGPEDVAGAMLLEMVIQNQAVRKQMGLALQTMFRDGYVYGMGLVVPRWVMEKGRKTRKQRDTYTSILTNEPQGSGDLITTRQRGIVYEGNVLENIDPYLFLPDPNTPIHRLQESEYVGWIRRSNYPTMLNMELDSDGDIFNVKYLRKIDARSHFYYDKEELRADRDMIKERGSTNPVDTIYMCMEIIPREFRLSRADEPQKWIFALSGDEVITMASHLDLDHNMYPVVQNAPDFDGYSICPISRIEVLDGPQNFLNFLINSHMTNIRKAINDMIIYDPSILNSKDMEEPGAGKLVKVKRTALGADLNKAVKQLAVQDITRQNIGDAGYVNEIMQMVSGATDSVQGLLKKTGERVTAAQFRGTHSGALSKLERSARISSIMAMQNLGMMLASHTQQFMTEDTYVQITDDTMVSMLSDFGYTPERGRLLVRPEYLSVDYDVRVKDGSLAGIQYLDTWTQIFQTLVSQPELALQFDLVRIFTHIARLAGAKNINDFVKKGGSVQAQVLPDAQVQNMAASGQILPVGGGYG